jgi:hypothetical protein
MQALVDELASRPSRDSVLLFHQLAPDAVNASDFEAWLERLLPERYRGRVSTELFRQYWQANKTARKLGATAEVADHPVRLVPLIRESTLPPTGGVHSVSRIGFSPSGDSALVTVSFACRGLCGWSDLFLYIRTATGWERRRTLLSVVH